MNEVTIDKKKYVIIPRSEYQLLQRKAAMKTKTDKLLSITEARSLSKDLIKKWAKDK